MPHTTSLELSKRLYELGVRMKTEVYHNVRLGTICHTNHRHFVRGWEKDYVSAFSTDELLEVLPRGFMITRGFNTLFEVSDRDINGGFIFREYTLPEALGNMLAYLLEHGYKWENGKVVKG